MHQNNRGYWGVDFVVHPEDTVHYLLFEIYRAGGRLHWTQSRLNGTQLIEALENFSIKFVHGYFVEEGHNAIQ